MLVLLSALQQNCAAGLGYTSDAIELANAGREPEALFLFQKHAEQFPHDGPGWNNLGVATMRAGLREVSGSSIRARELLLEAAQHFKRSLALNYGVSAAGNYRSVQINLSSRFQENVPELANDSLAVRHPSQFCNEAAVVSADDVDACGWDPLKVSTAAVRS
jgi:hypothetical protein